MRNCFDFLGCFNLDWKGDGICDDQNNHGGCNFDGGDCCGSNVNTDWCTLCQCLEEGKGGSGGTTTPSGTATVWSLNISACRKFSLSLSTYFFGWAKHNIEQHYNITTLQCCIEIPML